MFPSVVGGDVLQLLNKISPVSHTCPFPWLQNCNATGPHKWPVLDWSGPGLSELDPSGTRPVIFQACSSLEVATLLPLCLLACTGFMADCSIRTISRCLWTLLVIGDLLRLIFLVLL